MVALLYFEEKVHTNKLLRADAIPLLFPRLLCHILEHLGYPSKPQLECRCIFREIFTLNKWTSMTTYDVEPGAPAGPEHLEIPHSEHPDEPQPVEISADMRAPAPVVPSTRPMPEVAPSLLHATPGTPPVIPSTDSFPVGVSTDSCPAGEHRSTVQKNISKCRSDISGSFRRTPRHCTKWLRNSPSKRYQRIRICLTGEVETPSSPIRRQGPNAKYPDGMSAEKNSRCETSRWKCQRSRIPDVIHLGGMSAEQNSGCETSGRNVRCHNPHSAAL
uniref:Uncharacterized protein n=1 Tax=Vitis vinifera TaxID=29760 RepID=A5AYI2_VITVI|nr:hypothetical protein VITISV_025048 [Vitis vinifera]